MKKRLILSTFLLLRFCFCFSQVGEYQYKRQINDVSAQWHKLVLPNDIFSKLTPNQKDLRIISITAENDSIEAPYLLEIASEKNGLQQVEFNRINSVRTAEGYYETFEVPTEKSINHIKLEFEEDNFDWKVKLEGSNDQQEWFNILEDYRIVSIQNRFTDYEFSSLNFPPSKYRYFRLFIPSTTNPKLDEANLSLQQKTNGNYRNYDTKHTEVNHVGNKTLIDIELEQEVPVSYLKLNFRDSIDYFRPMNIMFVVDSLNTEKGRKYNYELLTDGTLSSVSKNEFHFNSTVAKKLRILIENFDNRPLQFEDVEIKAPVHQLIVRFDEPADYFLFYGNEKARQPIYDIQNFKDKIPGNLSAVSLGGEKQISEGVNAQMLPIFANKIWLWAIMIVIILLLGYFALKMMRNN